MSQFFPIAGKEEGSNPSTSSARKSAQLEARHQQPETIRQELKWGLNQCHSFKQKGVSRNSAVGIKQHQLNHSSHILYKGR